MLVWLMTLRQNLGIPYGGPFYYADPPNATNPVMPKFKLTAKQAFASDKYVEVYFSEAGLPLLAKHRTNPGRVLVWQMVWIWNRHGEMTRRYIEGPQGQLVDTFVAPTPTETPDRK